MNDTTFEISEMQDKIYRDMDPVKRFQIGADFIDMGWNIRFNAIKEAHPDLSDNELIRLIVNNVYDIVLDDKR